jgi:small subunit ribosomal protein S20
MPVTKSAKKALRVDIRRKEENIATKTIYKKAVKLARKAVQEGASELSDLLSKAQSALDKAAKSNTIHRNKAARLKSRLAKKQAGEVAAPTKKKAAKKAAPKSSKKK